jgi:putative NIF3 family GTP cyclohydrolase 1 type 2
MTYETIEVPFQTWGNRQYLTDLQLMENPELRDFVERFRECFERDDLRCIWIYAP